jgi:hypothetical protein
VKAAWVTEGGRERGWAEIRAGHVTFTNGWRQDCAEDELSSEDWIVLERIKSFLEKLNMTTKALESSFATLENVLLAMDFVLARFEAGKEAAINDAVLAPMYNSGWANVMITPNLCGV